MLGENFGVSEYYKAILCPGESYIQPSWIVKEANAWGLIASYTREEDEVLLSSLETVNWGDFDLFVEVRVKLTMSLHVAHQKGSLTFIRGDYAYLIGS
jgi:hypothetical protein